MEEKYFYLFFFKQCETILYTFITIVCIIYKILLRKKKQKKRKLNSMRYHRASKSTIILNKHK